MTLTAQAIHLSNYSYRPALPLTADEEIDAMLRCEDLNIRFDWFVLLARKYRKEVNENAYTRLRQIWRESRETWS